MLCVRSASANRKKIRDEPDGNPEDEELQAECDRVPAVALPSFEVQSLLNDAGDLLERSKYQQSSKDKRDETHLITDNLAHLLDPS